MNDRPEKRLYRMLEKKGFRPTHVVEVGVWMPEMSNIFDYIEAGIRTTLVEPDHASIARIKERFGAYDNVTLHEVAAYDFEGELELSQRDASTFVSELEASPAIVNDGYEVSRAARPLSLSKRTVPFTSIRRSPRSKRGWRRMATSSTSRTRAIPFTSGPTGFPLVRMTGWLWRGRMRGYASAASESNSPASQGAIASARHPSPESAAEASGSAG